MQLLSKDSCPWWGKIGLLWLLLVPLGLAIYVLAQPLAPNDLWYHVRAGEWMVQHQRFPRFALFTPSVPAATTYFYQSWLAEIVLFLTLKWSGLAGSQILRAVCFTGTMAIFITVAQQRAKVLLTTSDVDAFNEGARRVTLVGLFALFMVIPNTDLRPQTFSLPLFAVFAAVIFSWSTTKRRQLTIRGIILVALMAIWANTHGAFATGLILLLVYCVGETLHYLWRKPSRYLGHCLDKSQLKIIWIAFIGSVLAACINPRGWGIYEYVYALTGNIIGKKYIQEWQPPTWADGSNSVFFCCGIATLLMVLLLWERHRKRKDGIAAWEVPAKSTFGALGLRPGELLVIAAFFVMGLRNVRSIIWFALLFIVVATALLCRIWVARPPQVLPAIPLSMQRINVVLALCMCALLFPFLPWFKPLLPWPSSYVKRFTTTSDPDSPEAVKNAPPLMLANNTPVGGAIFLRKNSPEGLLWNDMVFGSYLVWALPPENGPWADPRVELRSDAFWETYLQTCHAKNNPSITLPQRGFTDVLIDKRATNQSKLKESLQASPDWKIAYEDRISLLFRTTKR